MNVLNIFFTTSYCVKWIAEEKIVEGQADML